MTERRAPYEHPDMPDMDTEQLLGEWFEAEAPTREPAVFAPNVIARTAMTRRRSRFLVRDWWRDLFRDDRRPSLMQALGATAFVLVGCLGLTAYLKHEARCCAVSSRGCAAQLQSSSRSLWP